MNKRELTVWERIRHKAIERAGGYVINARKVNALSGIPDEIATPVRDGTHNLIIDMTGRPTLQARWKSSVA